MGVKYSLVHRSVLLNGVGSHGYSTREAVNSVKLCHIGARVADSKDKQKEAIASFVLGSDVPNCVWTVLVLHSATTAVVILLLMFQGLLDASVYTC